MRNRLAIMIALLIVLNVNLAASGPHVSGNAGHQAAAGPPPIAAQVTFLYFNDLKKATEFYGKTLGLRATFDAGWVKIFALSPTSSLGLVDAIHGTHRPSKVKPLMISLVVDGPDQVDRWFSYLKSQGVEIPKPPANSTRAPVRAFGFVDSEGHSLEVFTWLKR
jgi:catechol 2,3-dioxygenase-like lactoylglutathione lyase family enzyme